MLYNHRHGYAAQTSVQYVVFVRFSEWDNQAGESSADGEKQQYDIGFNYWLHENVVMKADYRHDNNEGDSEEFSGFNLGVGWSF